jgi:enoyl-CoA hydratase/carnithine racemase
MGSVSLERRGRVAVVTLNRPERKNAVDLPTARALYDVFKQFDAEAALDVAVFTGAGGTFCAGADLKAVAEGERRPVERDGDFGPMGPTRLKLSKPVIAAIEGHAVAGGLELALWCDLRVAGRAAIFGVFNRRFGVPLIDLGTIRLPRLIGHGRALDLVLTGRPVAADEAFAIGLVNRVVDDGKALDAALAIAEQLSSFPQTGLRSDRLSLLEQWGTTEDAAARNEVAHGLRAIETGEMFKGAARFAGGEGRHGGFGKA